MEYFTQQILSAPVVNLTNRGHNIHVPPPVNVIGVRRGDKCYEVRFFANGEIFYFVDNEQSPRRKMHSRVLEYYGVNVDE